MSEWTDYATRRVDILELEDELWVGRKNARVAGNEALLSDYARAVAERWALDDEVKARLGYVPGGGPGRNGDELPEVPYNPADDDARGEWEREHAEEVELDRRAFAGERDALISWHGREWQRSAALAGEWRSSHAVRCRPFDSPQRRAYRRQRRAHPPRRRSAARCRAAPGRPSDADGEPPQVSGRAALLGATVKRILRDVVRAALAHRDRSSGRPK
ncbi:MAG: hypothetical protein ACREJ3_05370 [Polyangiaceae bacterium]